MWAGLLLAAAGVALLLPRAPARGYTGRKPSGHLGTERHQLGPHVCLSGFGSGCCPGWAPSLGSGHCILPLCSFGCGRGICIAPNVCSCQDGEQGPTCPDAHGPCGEYGCDLACNHGGCQEVARVCPVGFSMTETAVGIRCTDIDECLSASCEGQCVNTEGGFVCECGPGMQLSTDRHSCQDMDECLGTPCQQRCRNSIGSYRCSCRPGFHLHGNRHSCVDVNECRRPQERRVCHHACHNTVGSFLCTCRPGFRLRADRVSCEAFPTAMLAPSAILQPPQPPPNVLLLLPEAGRPALSLGRPPPSGAPGAPAGVRTTCLPSHPSAPPAASPSVLARLLATPMATPVPSVPLLGTLRPSSQPHERAGVTPSSPRGPTAPQPTPGPSACWHLGATYESGSHWTAPGCAQCWCEDGEVTCEEVPCEAACSHPIPARDGGCCPSCAGCFHSGVVRAEGAVFSPPTENCTVCVCLAGNVSCISPECPPGPCKTSSESDCCPCAPGRCHFQGRWHADGAVFSGDDDQCTTCVCQDGEVECAFTPCPELDCPREEWWLGPGQCCFTCREPAPKTDGSVSCKRTDCVDSCPHPIQIPGQCCPDCSAGCTYRGRIFHNNQTFPSVLDPCLSCICLLGSVACSPVDCPIACTYPFHPDGQCCPVCRDCNFEGRKVGNGQVFTLDDEPCTQCTCQLGEVSCEKAPCPTACTDAASPPGDCCSCPDSLEDGQEPPPPADTALSPRGTPQDPATCSSCPGPLAARPQQPTPHFLQLVLRTNVSKLQTLSQSRSGNQAYPPPPDGPSLGPPTPPGASSLPPASPGAPTTPEPSATASGAHTMSRWPALAPAVLLGAPALSTADPSPPEAPTTRHGLSPTTSGLSAVTVTASPGALQPPATIASEEGPAG
ncbi:von Willebrand factor C and EGF domain-containing protein isoform X6 [Pipistrellus kuhlii]|uniref:von Willebrand factor C and EGF domain-containing protein isoform X5 n=1 Tax=Pipistrellus kuhlii TaxID=59472 RepID=UPI001E272513|nr:von Willebrand factor C and EGF domain-containing protein isoform X5 [Pipistrellus kuhlii]XP_045430009.1 von Willebrand factor C and EGF domain-containing protein isoform X6 [Pipistrellus kuhlii]